MAITDRSEHTNLTDDQYQYWLQRYQNYIGQGGNPDIAAENANNDLEGYRSTNIGVDPFANRAALNPAAQAYVATGQVPASSAATGGSGTATKAPAPNYVFFNGQKYDLSNPAQADAYYRSYSDYNLNQTETNTKTALQNAARTYGQNLTSLRQDMGNLDQSQQNYGQQASRQITDLGQGYDVGTENRRAYFARLSPNAYQSSQGTSQQFAKGQLDQGIGDVNSALQRANQQFGQQKQGLNTEQGNLQYGYDQYVNQANDALTKARQQAADYYDTQGANAFGATTPSAYSYSRNSFKPYEAKPVDLSQYTPYTNFGSLAAGQSAPTQAPINYNSVPSYQDLSSYLGYSPGPQEQDLLQKYLKG